MNDCPPRLRGDLSKWLCEINTGVYVGQVSSRVREALWERVCQNLHNGRATMVYTTNNEQSMSFRVHNTSWTPVDFDGITLMRRPLPQNSQSAQEELKPGFSKAAKRQFAQRAHTANRQNRDLFVAIDVETTGLKPDEDQIIEVAAIRVENGIQTGAFSCLVQCDRPLPDTIIKLTGITNRQLQEQGLPLQEALRKLVQFVGKDRLMGFNLGFDMEFLRVACERCDVPFPANRCTDLLAVARRKVFGVPNYKLATLARYFNLPQDGLHRAQNDCERIVQLYVKLNEMP